MRWDEGLKTRSGSDPYLGRESVYHLDRMILVSLERRREIADWTHSNECSRLQRAASELIPHGLSLALGIRELVRSGYLFPAKVLARPLVETVAVISYLADVGEDAVRLWERGWPYKLRPSLATMLSHMRGTKNDDSKTLAKEIVDHFNSLVHADPVGSSYNLGTDSAGRIGFISGPTAKAPEMCDDICFETAMYLVILSARMVQIFPEANRSPLPE